MASALSTPVAFIMWVFRYDALAPGVRRDEASFWHAHTGRSLPKRQFADERTMWTQVGEARPRRRPVLRMATAVGVSLGCRIVRTHDVRGTRRVCALLAAIMEVP